MELKPPRSDYRIVLADPPWAYYGDPSKDQAAGKHYACLSTDAICELSPRALVAEPAALFLWATGPKLPDAIRVMEAWGFYYRGVAYVWVKTSTGGKIIEGQGVRPTFVKPTTEFLLVGSTAKKGRPLPLMTESQGQVVLAPRPGNKHSAKPDVFRERIVELLGDLSRLEMFARTAAPGWDVWGLEAPTLEATGSPATPSRLPDPASKA